VVAAQLAAIVEGEDVVRTVTSRGGRVHAQQQLDSVVAEHLAKRLAQRRGLAGKYVSSGLDEADLATETAHCLRHLGADRPAAEDQQPPRDCLHPGHPAVGPHTLKLAQAQDRRHHRIGAGRHDDMPGGMAHPIDLDHAGPGELAGAAQQVDALARQPPLLPGVGIIRDHEVTPGQRGVDVDLRAGGRLPRALHRLTGTEQRLGRDTCPVGALAPDQLPLDQGNPQAAVGQLTDTVLTRRATTDDDHVVVVTAHVLDAVLRPPATYRSPALGSMNASPAAKPPLASCRAASGAMGSSGRTCRPMAPPSRGDAHGSPGQPAFTYGCPVSQ
jgi:hypothetical protein